MNLDADKDRAYRVPVRKIKNALLRRTVMLALYPFMVLWALFAAAANVLLLWLVVLVKLVVMTVQTPWVYLRDFHRTFGPAWRGEPL